MKFMFPNALGVYLHDTPDRSAFGGSQRTLSSGCVRLEDADRLWRWLHGFAPQAVGTGVPEQAVSLPDPVPVYILYLTVRPDGRGAVARAGDPYGLDAGLSSELDGCAARSRPNERQGRTGDGGAPPGTGPWERRLILQPNAGPAVKNIVGVRRARGDSPVLKEIWP